MPSPAISVHLIKIAVVQLVPVAKTEPSALAAMQAILSIRQAIFVKHKIHAIVHAPNAQKINANNV